jgi:hypothetical protein
MKALGLVWILGLLGACPEAVDWGRNKPVEVKTLLSAQPSWRAWLKEKIGSGSGYGYGYGYGDGYGDGSGSGYGDGYGDGSGSGSGSGSGYGSGYGYGSGSGSGYSYGGSQDITRIEAGGESLDGDVHSKILHFIAEEIASAT